MIKDRLENIGRYFINDHFELFRKAVKVSNDYPKELELPLKVIPLKYQTKDFDTTKFENHERNIDVHFLVNGKEQIGVNQVPNLTSVTAYDEKNDFQLFRGEVAERITLHADEFLVLFPGEAHVTGGLAENNSSAVEKMVYKIPFDSSIQDS